MPATVRVYGGIMTVWINTGVREYTETHSPRVPTKARLKLLAREAPGSLRFDVTSALGPRSGETLKLSDLADGEAFQVVGPDPHQDRRWYATVRLARSGGYSVT
jgi:hypothetical protein